ncbi:hypothetical protein [Domibacillus iocasae]|nr:hypothetical protein [Domibacillus iocasae]
MTTDNEMANDSLIGRTIEESLAFIRFDLNRRVNAGRLPRFLSLI